MSRSPKINVSKKCRFCKNYLPNSETFNLKKCDQDKLANWWEIMLKNDFEETDVLKRGGKHLVCIFCVSEARYYHEHTGGADDLVWWNVNEPLYKYYRDELIQPCTVQLTKLTDYTIYTWTNNNHTYWTCFLCNDKKYATVNAMYLHVWFKHKEYKIKCYKNGCYIYFKERCEMEEHFRTCHEESKNMLKCVLCSKVFFGPKKKYLESSHMKTLHPDNSFRCLSPNCCRYFVSKTEMEAHVKENHEHLLNKNKLWCIFCDKDFYQHASLKYHLKTSHRRKAIYCPISKCTGYFATKSDLQEHIEFVHDRERVEDKVSCLICCKKVSSLRINHHMRNVHPKDAFKCKKKICNTYFKTRDEAENHFRTHTAPSQQRFQRHDAFHCDICNLQTSWKHNMEMHFQIKHFPRTIKCTDCKKLFATEDHLNEHRRKTHNKNRKKCPHCGKTPALYNSHVVTNKCFKCFKEFECFTLARAHRGKCRLVFQCDLCPKKSNYEQFHIKHFRAVHKGKIGVGHWMGAKKYKNSGFKCNACKFYFPHEGFYNNHMKNFHQLNNQVNCHFCGAVRRSKKYLEYHMKKEHHPLLKMRN